MEKHRMKWRMRLAMAFVLSLGELFSACSPKATGFQGDNVRHERVVADTATITSGSRRKLEQVALWDRSRESLVHKEKETVKVNESGDTIRHDRFLYIHLSTVERLAFERLIACQSDSISRLEARFKAERVDTVRVPYPVERSLTAWENTKMAVGGWAIGVLVVVVLVIFILIWLVKIKRLR